MTQTMWLMLAIAVVAVVIGFLVGRLTAPRERQYQEARSELERTQRERDELRSQVEDHFQHTAALFGNLSRDYRALYLHFAEGARSLGLGEEPAQRLIEEARASADEPADPEATAATPPIDPEPDAVSDRARPEADDAPEEKPRPAHATEDRAHTAAKDQGEHSAGDGQAEPAPPAGGEDAERRVESEAEAESAEHATAKARPQEERRAGE